MTSKFLYAASNLFLMIPFVLAILNPIESIEFISRVGVLIYLTEFFSIHSTLALVDSSHFSLRKRLFILTIYIVFLVSLLIDNPNVYVLYFASGSFIVKFFLNKFQSDEDRAIKETLVFLGATFILIPMRGIIEEIIPLPTEVTNSITGEGLFNETPQIVLVWGILYSIGLFVSELIDVSFPITVSKHPFLKK